MAGQVFRRVLAASSVRSRNAAAMIGPLELLICDRGAEFMRILLVEDEAEMACALASALKRYDMVVLRQQDGVSYTHIPSACD